MSRAHTVNFDSSQLRVAYRQAGQHLIDVARVVDPARLGETALDLWSLRDLLGHASRGLTTVPTYLQAGRGLTVVLCHAFDYVSAYASSHGDPNAIAERARSSGNGLGGDVVAGLQTVFEEAMEAVDGHPDDAPVKSPAGVMRLIDYLPNRIFELVTHSEDIKVSQEIQATPGKAPLTVALTFCAALAASTNSYQKALFGLTGRADFGRFSVLG